MKLGDIMVRMRDVVYLFFSSIEHLAFSIWGLVYTSLSFIASVAFWAISNRTKIFLGLQSDNLLLSHVYGS